MDHRTIENFLVSEQKVVFDRSWKLNLLSAHSEFLIYVWRSRIFSRMSLNTIPNKRAE